MKKLEKWLTKPFCQRMAYLLLMILCLRIFQNNGMLGRAGYSTLGEIQASAVLLFPLLLLGAQLVWNKLWLWRLLCGLLIVFTLWLATLSLPQIISGAGAGSIVWAVGILGFSILLVLVLAFTNWVLLHMKPKR